MASRTKVTISDISQESFEQAIKILEEGGTKVAACKALGIKYNTTKLDQLIKDFQTFRDREKRLRAQKRKEALTNEDMVEIIERYLAGVALKEIADDLYISVDRVKSVLERKSVPARETTANYYEPPLFPDRCVGETFEVGEWVWASRYNSLAKISGEFKGAYRIIIANEHRRKAYQDPADLAKLTHLENLGVNLSKLTVFLEEDEQKALINQGLRNIKRKGK